MKKYSNKILSQSIVNILEKKGIRDIVISPGSRNAPLTIGFSKNDFFKTYSIVDERCAGFFGVGMSKKSKIPTILLCTSGSALLNYYPAISEAFYSQIPIIIISADRPNKWINQGDGQTIKQQNLFKNHVVKSYQLKEEDNREAIWYNERCINEAVNICRKTNKPVHINVPFSEPLYQITDQKHTPIIIYSHSYDKELSESGFNRLLNIWNSSGKKLILVGEEYTDKNLSKSLNIISDFDDSTLILTETTSNLYGKKFIDGIDKFIVSFNEEDKQNFKPDLLVILGKAVVSKKIKSLLRSYDIDNCWKFSKSEEIEDTYQNVTDIITMEEYLFFEKLIDSAKKIDTSNYSSYFLKMRDTQEKKHAKFLGDINEFVDFKVFDEILNNIPKNEVLHLSNSSVIRYSQLFKLDNTLEVYCNRGTSGIDGSTSTAIGFSINSDKNNTLITGDISFFYDSNALWNNYLKNNFKIILINNRGGNIFKIISEYDNTYELETFFETKHSINAKNICKTYNVEYIESDNYKSLETSLNNFWKINRPTLLEIFTDGDKSAKTLKQYFDVLSNN